MTLIIALKALTEVAGMALLGQGALFMLIALTGGDHERNFFYGILKVITSPVMRATRFIAPRFIVDQHIGFLAFFLVVVLWMLFTVIKVNMLLPVA